VHNPIPFATSSTNTASFQETQQRIALLADVSKPVMAGTGVLIGNEHHVAADLLAARKPSGVPMTST